MRISVAMAVYQGSRYLQEQMDSILIQCGPDDQIVCSCDASTDGSWEILQAYARRDSRVEPCRGPGKGVVANFEHALRRCTGDVVFLSDQDDRWRIDKREKVLQTMQKTGASLILHDAQIIDADGRVMEESYFAMRGSRPGYWKNLWKNSYIGCCMAFTQTLCQAVLPFPTPIPMHDQYIGLRAEQRHAVAFCPEPLIQYRRHADNATDQKHANLQTMLRWRWQIMCALRRGR